MSPKRRTVCRKRTNSRRLRSKRVEGIACLHAQHHRECDERGDPRCRVGGHYEFHFARTPQGWLTNYYKINISWMESNCAIFSFARK